MIDTLLKHYEKELAYINRAAKDFARRYPKIAGRLKLGADELEDPLIERLISAFSFLNARIQDKLEDDFPELSNAVLDTLYPHYNRPIPPMSIAKFDVKKGLKEHSHVPVGAQLETYTFEEKRCNFQTCYDVELYPLTTRDAQILFRPFIAPAANEIAGNSVIHLSLQASPGASLKDLSLADLTFYIGGQDQRRYILYELLFTQLKAVVVASENNDEPPVILDANRLEPVGFGLSEGMLPYPGNVFIGYRLLTEFFTFPDKFFFFRLTGLDAIDLEAYGDSLDLYFYLGNADADLEHFLSAEMFQLGCTPVVNMFSQTAEPIRLDNNRTSYQVAADVGQPENVEIYSIESVKGVNDDGKSISFEPFYGNRYLSDQTSRCLWHATRHITLEGEHNSEVASELDLSFVDLDFNPATTGDTIISVETQCLNRNTPSKLPFAGRLPLKNVDGSVPPIDMYCITPPTPTLRISADEGNYWRLVSHLNLNHLSFTTSEFSLVALQEILRLYDFRSSASSKAMIASIDALTVKPISAPIDVDGRSVLCRGSEVTIIFDPLKLGGQSAYLFACVLEAFLGLYCTINSFVKVIARLKGSEEDLKKWPPRAGEHQLL